METGIPTLRPIHGSIAGVLLVGAACTLAPTAPDRLARFGARPASRPETPEVAGATEPRADVPEQSESLVDEREPPLLDSWSLAARESGEACRSELTTAGFKFRAFAEKAKPDKSGCGIPHPVLVLRGPTGIVYEPPLALDCALARALGSVERIVQEEAERHLHSPVARIGNLGGYACRPRNSRKGASLSAHAFGSAVDLSSFHPAKGKPAIIAADYEPKRPSPAQEDRRRFLHAVFGRLRRHEADLTYAVGPDFNALHHNHFHLDRGGWHFWFNR